MTKNLKILLIQCNTTTVQDFSEDRVFVVPYMYFTKTFNEQLKLMTALVHLHVFLLFIAKNGESLIHLSTQP